MAVMQMPMVRSLLLLLLLATPFFLLVSHPSPASSSPPDVDLNYLIVDAGGHIPGANDRDEHQELFASDDYRRSQEDHEVVNEAHVIVLTAANFTSFIGVRRHVVVRLLGALVLLVLQAHPRVRRGRITPGQRGA